jgi:heme-degrading monooxygenase HmoA
MIIVTITHHVRSGELEKARRRIGENTEQMARHPGFLFRHTGSPIGEPQQIVTVTGWGSREDLESWDAAKRALPGQDSGMSVYERVERSTIETYDQRWVDAIHATRES